ncbi:hypothetical protein [Chroococcus sp. FPU101]|uniref:hypothetical protein n=1 Tax=Chroococcus sp. FPU101 TaxID=1974212 RepID=UPI001A8F9E50|nr:hypothetical protein [Chroococcus sp. FPU101]GFE71282.1 hypothetical protein CFPU101_38920 [Chroococcus sp. FPU101]
MNLSKTKNIPPFLCWGICYFVLVGLISVRLGQDVSWDLRNYHFYNPYMLLTGRMKYDILPAQIQTFFNPLIDVPFFIFIYYLKIPPLVFGFFWGGLHGLNLWLIHKIVYHSLLNIKNYTRHFLSCFAALTGLWGAAYYSEIGTVIGDSTSSLFILTSLLIIVYHLANFGKLSLRNIIIAGFLTGLGVGLKLTVALYGIALIISINFIRNKLQEKFLNLLALMSSMFAGFLVTAGYWMVLMWLNFSSPLFPFFNKFFKSPYIRTDFDLKDTRFLPRDIWQSLFYPFYFTKKQSLVAELEFQDSRLAIAYIFVIIFLIFLVIKFIQKINRTSYNIVNPSVIFLIVPFYVASYLIWLKLFSIYRYLLVLELLTPVLIILILGYIYPSRKVLLVLSAILFTVMITTTKPLDWSRLPWQSNYFGIETKALKKYENKVIVMWGDDGNSYLVPYFPSSTRFVRIQGNTGLEKGTLLQKKANQIIENTPDENLYLLDISPDQLNPEEKQSQKDYKLLVDYQNCQQFSTHVAKYSICPLRKLE